METVFIILGVLAFIGLVIWIGHVMEKKRTQAMKVAADAMGYAFEEQRPDLIGELGAFHLFQQGRSKRLRNVISGSQGGVAFKIFDYRYTIGSGKNSQTIRQTVAHVRSDRLRLPGFALRPENIFHKIGGVFGYQDIDFDSHPTFSKKYLLRGQEEQEIRQAFAPHVLDHFDQNHGLSVEGFGEELVVYRGGRQLKPDTLQTHLDDAIRVHGLFAV